MRAVEEAISQVKYLSSNVRVGNTLFVPLLSLMLAVMISVYEVKRMIRVLIPCFQSIAQDALLTQDGPRSRCSLSHTSLLK
jgi:hypothetical protein